MSTADDRDTAGVLERLEAMILDGEPRYTRLEVAERAGVSIDTAQLLWRALGFASPGDQEKVFNEEDVRALSLLSALAGLGAVDDENVGALARAVGQSFARLTQWQTDVLSDVLTGAGGQPGEEAMLTVADELLPLMEHVHSYVWRRHLATSVGRTLAHPSADAGADPLVVGFADIVGYTSMSRQLADDELGAMIEHFESTANALVADHHGRVIKTIGDEVMFVADTAERGADVALSLAARAAHEEAMPGLRIGLAYGGVLSRLGDVYGPVVNVASRLTTVARPGAVVVDRGLAEALAGVPRFHLRRIRRVSVRGYRRLEPWLLRSADRH